MMDWEVLAKIVGIVTGAGGVILAVYGFFRTLERRLTTLETWRDHVNARIEELDERIDKRLANIERKQDRLLELFAGRRREIDEG